MFTKPCLALLGLIAFPLVAHGQGPAATPQEYCRALAREFGKYTAPDAHYIASFTYGEAARKEHDAIDAIPVLEKALTEAKLPLPPHLPSAKAAKGD